MKNVDNISENKRLNAMRRLLFISFVILIIHCANDKLPFANGVDVRKISFFLFAGFVLCSIQMRLMERVSDGLRMQYMAKFIKS